MVYHCLLRGGIILVMERLRAELQQIVKRLFGVEIEVELTVPPAEMQADYATNVALKLAKVAHRSPLEIAEQIKSELIVAMPELGVEVARPGFLNCRFSDEYFRGQVQQGLEQGINISSDEYIDKVVVSEFSDPNPFKVLHVGHFYTSVVGDAISHLLEFAGAKVYRTNFGGDVGLHVGKTLWAVQQRKYSPDDITVDRLGECYVEGTGAYEENEAAKTEITEINKTVYQIAALGETESVAQYGDLAALYWRGRQLSYEYFADFYAQIGLQFDKYYPESGVAGRGLAEVKAHLGTTYEESNGAIVYKGEKVGLHTRVFVNQTGVPTYEAKDVGLLFTKWDDYHFDESVVITGNEIIDYMKVVLASVHEYAPELVERTTHLTHGMVRLQGNVKMSSRKGNFLKAVDVLELIREAMRTEHGKTDEKVVLAAVKYAFLKYKIGGDIIFDPQESVATNGNSGVYLLYSAVRAQKILQKLENSAKDELNKKFVQEQTEVEKTRERILNKKIVQYAEVLSEAVREMAPYKVCNYLYELAQEFSRFYEHVPVVGNPRADELAVTIRAYYRVMEHGLGLLGIEIPEEM